MARPELGFTFSNVVNILRFARIHRLYFSAAALGLGVSMEKTADTLMLRMSSSLGAATRTEPEYFLLREPRR